MLKRIILCQVTKKHRFHKNKQRSISIIKPNSNSKIRNSLLNKKQLFTTEENNRLIQMFQQRMVAITSKCTKTRLSNTKRKMRNRNKMREKQDGRITTMKNLRFRIEIRIKMEHIKELRVTTSMARKLMPMICSMKRKRMIRSIFNISKVRTSNTPIKERKMS